MMISLRDGSKACLTQIAPSKMSAWPHAPPIKMPTAWDLYPLGLERKKSRIAVALILAAAAAAGTALISSVVVARAGGFPTAPW